MANSIDQITDFQAEIDAYNAEFFAGTRQWLDELVDEFISAEDRRHLIIIGEPGVGKSAYIAHLAERYHCPRYFTRSQEDPFESPTEWVDPKTFLFTIGHQLGQMYGPDIFDNGLSIRGEVDVGLAIEQADAVGVEIEEAYVSPFRKMMVEGLVKSREIGGKVRLSGVRIKRVYLSARDMKPADLLHEAVLDPLKRIAELYKDETVVLLLDGLDVSLKETGDLQEDSDQILNVIPRADNLRVIMTSRPGDHLTRFHTGDKITLTETGEVKLDDMSRNFITQNRDDAYAYISHVIHTDPIIAPAVRISEEITTEQYIDLVSAGSDGNFLYLHHFFPALREDVKEDRADFLKSEGVPKGLNAFYRAILIERIMRGVSEERWEDVYVPVLGVLAIAQEALTRKQIANFAGVKPKQADSVLKRIKQFLDVLSGEEENEYRFYHTSFSEFLLDSKHNDYSLSGPEFHYQIASYYLGNKHNWQHVAWERKEYQYPIHYLASHLKSAEHFDELHELVATGERRNNWADAHYRATGGYTTYLQDLDVAQSLAKKVDHQRIGKLVRYAFIRSSVLSQSIELSENVLPTLVEENLLTPQSALSLISQFPKGGPKSQTLIEIVPMLPDSLKYDALMVVSEIEDEYGRSEALIGLIDHANGMWGIEQLKEALLIAQRLDDAKLRATTLSRLTKCFPPDLQKEVSDQALNNAKALKYRDGWIDDRVFIEVVSNLPVNLRSEVVSVVKELPEDWDRGRLLGGLADLVPGESRRSILLEVQKINDPGARASALSKFVGLLPERMNRKVIKDIRALAHRLENMFLRAEIFTILASNLEGKEKLKVAREALKSCLNISEPLWRAEKLSKLIDHLPADLKETATQEEFSAIFKIDDDDEAWRAKLLTKLASDAPATWKLTVIREAFNAVWGRYDTYWFQTEFDKLGPLLSREQLTQALYQIPKISYKDHRQDAFGALVKYLPFDLKRESFSFIDKIENETQKAYLLRELISHLPNDLMTDALEAISKIQNDYWRGYALVALIPSMPDSLVDDVIEMTRKLTDHEGMQTEVLIQLVPRLPTPARDEMFDEVLRLAGSESLGFRRKELLYKVAMHASGMKRVEILRDAMAAAQEIGDIWVYKDFLDELMSHLPKGVQSEIIISILAQINEIEHDRFRERALRIFIKHLNAELSYDAGQQLLAIISSFDFLRDFFLSNVVPFLPDKLISELWSRAERLEDPVEKIRSLTMLAPSVPSHLQSSILDLISSLESKYVRSQVFEKLIPYLDESLMNRAVEEVKEILKHKSWDNSILTLIEHIPDYMKTEFIDEALTAAWKLPEGTWRATVLYELAQFIPDESKVEALHEVIDWIGEINEFERVPILMAIPDLLENLPSRIEEDKISAAMSVVLEIPDQKLRAQTLCKYSKLQSGQPKFDTINEALGMVSNFADSEFSYGRALIEISEFIPEECQNLILTATNKIRDSYKQSGVLLELIMNISAMHKFDFSKAALDAAKDSDNPGHQAWALSDLAPYISIELMDDLWDAVQKIEEEESYNFAFCRVAGYLTDGDNTSVMNEALERVNLINDKRLRAIALSDLAPYITDPEKFKMVVNQGLLEISETDNIRGDEKATAYSQIISSWSKQDVFDPQEEIQILGDTLLVMGRQHRREMLMSLASLTPLILRTGGSLVINECLHAIRDVFRWWP